MTAFTTGGVEYLGIAWNNQDKHRVFTRIPVDRSKPNKLDPSRAIDRVYTGDQDTWGYSCYVDSSNRNWFWASYAPWAYQGKNVPIHGVDLNSDSLNELTSEQIPNKNFTSTSLSGAGYSWQGAPIAGNASYSMSGDAGGNILTGSSAYAFTHETKNNLIYSSGHNNGWMTVSKAECYSSTVDCTGKQWGFHLGDLTDNSGATVQSIGPISSLNDGSVVGISRGSVTSVVYLLSPKTAGDPAQGMNFTLIKAVRGDAYMYNDFTGATLYAQTQDKVFDLRKLKGFNPKYPLISTSFSWVSESGMADPWFGLKLEARCFNAQTAASTSLVRVTDIQPAGQSTLVNIPSCRQPGFDQLEVKVTQDGASASFSHATKIRIQATQ